MTEAAQPAATSNEASDISIAGTDIPDSEWQSLTNQDSETTHSFDDESLAEPAEPFEAPTDKVKLKVYGKEFELPIDEGISAAQQHYAAQNQLKEVNEARSKLMNQAVQVKQLMDVMQSGNPEVLAELFRHLGQDFDAIATRRVKELFDFDIMTPEQKRAYQMQKQLERYKAHEQQQLQAQQQQQYHAQIAATAQQIVPQMQEAIKTTGLPNTPAVLKRMAEVAMAARKNGTLQNVNQVAAYVKQELESIKMNDFSQYDVDQLLKVIPKEKVQQIIEKRTPVKKFTMDKSAPARSKQMAKKPTWKQIFG
jgi:hypothetical protein